MKQILLLLAFVALNVCTTYSQNQGYSWTFGAAPPFNSTPAMTGSTGSHQLTTIGDGDIGIAVAVDSVGLGTSCTTTNNVGSYSAPPTFFLFGLQFNNAPQFVDSVYTIEMTVKFDTSANFHRLLGFTDLAGPVDSIADNGIYITPDPTTDVGQVVFRVDSVEVTVGATTINDSTWYHLSFVRDANNIITFYINGVLQGNYNDSLGNFKPLASNGNVISFFKDNGTEEIAGAIAKLSIYNRVLTESEIVKRTFNNICNTNVVLSADPDEGHQWTFPNPPLNPPFISVPAVALSTGTYDLAQLGGNLITTGTTEIIGLGTSCTALFPTAVYLTDAGLDFDNSPRYIYDTYTLELAINFDVFDIDSTKVLGFYDLGTPPEGAYGIYVTQAGEIDFYNGTSHVIAASPLTAATWYHLVFVRSADDTISYYQNGVLIGTFVDSLDQFMPQGSTGNNIAFFKDDTGDQETTGKFTKIGIFNAVLSPDDVLERFNNICNTALVILPVNLTSFTATKSGKQVQLKWVTASEQNNLGFEVQRSSNGNSFSSIGFVNGNGTTSQQNTYYFTDQSPLAGKNYYRLKQIDIDNRVTYSALRIINMDAERQEVQLYPNPSRSVITITNIKAGNQLSVFNTYGNLVIRKIAGSSGQEAISVDKLAAGVYMLQVTDSDNFKHTIRFTKF